MRTINPALLAAQKFEQTIRGVSGKRIPWVELIFHSEDGSTVDYSERHKGIEHHEMMYDGHATILLRNDDHLVEDLIGYWVEIRYGDYFFDDDKVITGYGTPVWATSRLWVESQMDISFPGTKMVVLELHDSWKLLSDKPCIIDGVNELAPYHYARIEDHTPYEIIRMALNNAGFAPRTLDQSGDDGFIDTFISSAFFINGHYWTATISEDYKGKYESYKDVILRALSYTQCYLRAEGGADIPSFRIVYPEPVKGEREADETYYSYQAPWFNEFIYRKNIVSPNQVLTYCNYDWDIDAFDPDTIIIGQARDQDSIDRYAHTGFLGDGIVARIEWCPDITDQGNADSVAQAILSRQIVASRGGRLIIPHDARVELFDLVEAVDAR